ncbi:hypothetical protein V1509DRAFT_587898, partial [Lipomyces kononenkoae]
GGLAVLLETAGSDVTEQFEDIGHSDQARAILTRLQIGVVNGEATIGAVTSKTDFDIVDGNINHSNRSQKHVDPDIVYLWTVWFSCLIAFVV